ncbi:MAG TPA: GNAT family N-acetyltransferase [Pirellulales bacterium]|nr:GNAT family N-acetyltransferase [Pirellulales bacterium]
MIRYRAFRNSDPPALAEIWRSQPAEHGRVRPMSAALFEQFVLSKPYFDNAGLIVAVDDQLPVGFAHAAFGPNACGDRLARQMGSTCLVMVRTDYQGRGIGGELLSRSESYLRQRGAEVMYGGGIAPLNGFYLGLYGGSELPGVLDSDAGEQHLFESHGYREIDRVYVLERALAGFRPPIDRQQLQIRRRSTIEAMFDPPPHSWWEACAWSGLDQTLYELTSRDACRVVARATAWSIEPLSSSWGVRATGVTALEVEEASRRQGIATYLMSDIMRQLASQGTSLVQVQTMQANVPAQKLYEKLGFRLVNQGAVYRKDGSSA